jgi:hypothetical protein
VAVIDPAERLNEEGQNALLKTLEEPGVATFLLLTTTRPEGLLPTVRSRLGRYRMRPLPAAILTPALAAARPAIAADTRAWAVALGGGSLGFAQDLVDEPAARPLQARLLDFHAGRERDPHAVVDACFGDVTGKEARLARAALVLRLLRANLHAEISDGVARSVLAKSGEETYGAPLLDRWIESCEHVFAAEVDLQQHIAAEQTLLGLLLELAAA